MQGFNKRKYFQFIILMLMASVFLPLVFNNLPPIIRSYHLWTVLLGISLLFFEPKVLYSTLMLLVIVYGLFLFFALNTIWINMDEWNRNLLITEVYQIAVGASIITYFYRSKDFLGLAKITKWTLAFLCITAIMTLISVTIDPMYARKLGGVSGVNIESQREMILGYKRYGGGTYGTAAAFMCLLPLLIYLYKVSKSNHLRKRKILIFTFLILVALVSMQIFANILIAIVAITFAVLSTRHFKKSILIISAVFLLAVLIPKSIYVDTLINMGDLFDKESELSYKLYDFSTFIETGADFEDTRTGTGGRAERYPMLLEVFNKRPIMGCYFNSNESGNGYEIEGAHLHWMNKLTVCGILGLLIFLIIPAYQIKNSFQYFHKSYKLYFIIAALSILSYGLIKSIVGKEFWLSFFVLIPGIYYLPMLKREMSINKRVSESR